MPPVSDNTYFTNFIQKLLFIDGSDYIGIHDTLYFDIGSENGTTSCTSVSIINSASFEKNEAFTVHVVDTEDNVAIDQNQAVIHIIDTNCKKPILSVSTLRSFCHTILSCNLVLLTRGILCG